MSTAVHTDALELPDVQQQKPLLWRYGGRPKLHGTAEANHKLQKLQEVCDLLGCSTHEPHEALRHHSLMNEFKLIELHDSMDIDSLQSGKESNEESRIEWLLGLGSDASLRR